MNATAAWNPRSCRAGLGYRKHNGWSQLCSQLVLLFGFALLVLSFLTLVLLTALDKRLGFTAASP
jgi:hypothetical protein